MRFRGLLLCAAVLASGVAPASATMRIAEDRGGQIGHYLQTFAMLRSTGETSSSTAIACRPARWCSG